MIRTTLLLISIRKSTKSEADIDRSDVVQHRTNFCFGLKPVTLPDYRMPLHFKTDLRQMINRLQEKKLITFCRSPYISSPALEGRYFFSNNDMSWAVYHYPQEVNCQNLQQSVLHLVPSNGLSCQRVFLKIPQAFILCWKNSQSIKRGKEQFQTWMIVSLALLLLKDQMKD